MKNLYNKGSFRSYEWGKFGVYLKKYGNKKWRRTEKSEIENQFKETIKIFKQRKKRRKLIWLKSQKKYMAEHILITEASIRKKLSETQ